MNAYIVHHSQGRTPTSIEDAKRAIAEIHAYHRDSNGWPGFAYNDAIWQDVLFRVRPSDRMGWHSAGPDYNYNGIGDWNETGHAVCLLGTFTSQKPPEPYLDTILAGWSLVEQEVGGQALQLRGHRSGWQTTCPGDWWPAWSASQGGV